MRTKQTPVPARGLSNEYSDSEGDLEALEAWQGPAPIDSGGDSGRAHGAAPPQSGADGALPCATVQQMGAHDGGEPGSAAAAEAEVEAEGEADACAEADAETEAAGGGSVGTVWPMVRSAALPCMVGAAVFQWLMERSLTSWSDSHGSGGTRANPDSLDPANLA
jgi:hypothetical protein